MLEQASETIRHVSIPSPRSYTSVSTTVRWLPPSPGKSCLDLDNLFCEFVYRSWFSRAKNHMIHHAPAILRYVSRDATQHRFGRNGPAGPLQQSQFPILGITLCMPTSANMYWTQMTMTVSE